MRVSVRWLREWCPFEADGREVGRILTERGLTVDSVETLDDDVVLEIDVPANRPDALGHRGTARELAAAFGLELAAAPDPGASASAGPDVEVLDAAFCPRYTASVVRDVTDGPTPEWMRRRLEAVGLRSLGLVVDISNYVMLDLGQPIHFFDLDRLSGPRIVVRPARAGERLVTLDGEERVLSDGMGLIADADRAVAIAGVMGGRDSEIGAESRNVLVEAAHFDPVSVRRTARALGLHTDAAHRFERGVDPEAPAAAQALACELLKSLAGGSLDDGWTDVRAPVAEPATLRLRPERAARLLGYSPGVDEMVGALRALELGPEGTDPIEVRAPTWRFDLTREADLIEEVARHLGFDRIPSGPPDGGAPSSPDPVRSAADVEERVRDTLAACGFHEAFTYAMIGPEEDAAFVDAAAPDALGLENPLSEGWSHLRRSLLPGLLRAADANGRRGRSNLRLFETGRAFLAHGNAGSLPEEPLRAALLWTGRRHPAHWSTADRPAGFADLAGVVGRVLRSLDAGARWTAEPESLPGFAPGRAARWIDADGRRLARLGAWHPARAAESKIDGTVWLAEIELTGFIGERPGQPFHRPVSKFPSAQRDLSILLDAEVPYAAVREALEGVPAPAPVRWTVVDRFDGGDLPAGASAVLVRFVLEPPDRTLTDEETEAYRSALVDALDRLPGARLRES